jgi:hypothetical protein
MKKLRTLTTAAALFFMLSSTSTAAITEPVITSTVADTDAMTLLIEGTNLPKSVVFMGKSGGGVNRLSKISASSTHIEAQLRTDKPGTYVIALAIGAEHYWAGTVTIGESLDAMKTQITALQGQVAALLTQVSNNTSNISANQSQININTSNLQSLNMPMAAYSGDNMYLDVTSNYASYQSLKYVDITVPAGGVILLSATGFVHFTGTSRDYLLAGILAPWEGNPNSSWSAENAWYDHLTIVSDYDNTGTGDNAYTSFASQRGVSVSSGGTYRFHLWANKHAAVSVTSVGDINMSAKYFPN